MTVKKKAPAKKAPAAKQDNQPPAEKWVFVGLNVRIDEGEYRATSKDYKVSDKANGWDLIFEEPDRFRVIKDKPDGTRVVHVYPKDRLIHWSIDAKKED